MASEPYHTNHEDIKSDKKVHFRDALEHFFGQRSPGGSTRNSDSESSLVDVPLRSIVGKLRRTRSHEETDNCGNTNNNSNESHAVVQLRPQLSPSVNTYVGRLLTVSPAHELIFRKVIIRDAQKSTVQNLDLINLSNTLPNYVAFKIKTTAPKKFKVRPSIGFIPPNSSKEVSVYVITESEDLSKDKFLIMACEVDNDKVDIKQLFKTAPAEKLMHHKLTCTIGHDDDNVEDARPTFGLKHNVSDTVSKVEQLEIQTKHMHRQLNLLLIIQFLTALILILIMLSYSCFGEDLFTKYLALPFDFCHVPYGRKC